MDEEKQREVISKKVNYYFEKKADVHIVLDNNRFYNGIIKSIGSDFLIIDERRLGEACVFFAEIKDIEPYEEKERWK